MMNLVRILFVILPVGFALACGGGEETAEAPAEGEPETAAAQAETEAPEAGGTAEESRSPEAIAEAFMEAGNAADQEAFLELLTPAARTGLGGDDEGFSMTGGQFDEYEVGEATVEGQEASVPVTATQQGQPQDMSLKMRQESGAWRVYGMDMQAGEMSVSMNFEELGQMVEQMAQSMGDAMKEGFEASVQEWQAGGSEAQIAAARLSFETMEEISEEAYRADWMNEESFEGATVGEALKELADRLSLGLEPGAHAEKLSAAVEAGVAGLSNLEAVERLTDQVGLHPKYPDLQGGVGALGEAFAMALAEGFEKLFTGEDSAIRVEGMPEETMDSMRAAADAGDGPDPVITLVEGERKYPAAFAGPFMVEVFLVNEVPPHGTGTLSLRVLTFGMNPGLLKLVSEDAEGTTFGEVVDAQGRSLVDENVRYLSGGEVIGAAYHDLFHMNLMNLLRDVTAIEKVEGVQRVKLPIEIQDVTLEQPEKGMTRELGDFTLEVKGVGTNSRIDIEGPEAAMADAEVLLAADDAEGNPLGITFQDSMLWMPTKLQASLNTPEPPGTIHLKFISETETLEYPFELGPIPLEQYEQMPEKIAELEFGEAAAPLEAEFVRFMEDDPNFPEIEIQIVNHSNKDTTTYFADFIYEDASGEELDNMPTTLTGNFTPDGHQPLAEAGATTLHTTTAFSMPEDTVNVRIEPIHVEFVDGTKWEAER